jgi:uncharacterized protein
MNETLSKPCTAFIGNRLLSAGPLIEVALAVRYATEGGGTDAILTFDDATGRVIDLDLRGTKADLIARLAAPIAASESRPKAQAPVESEAAGNATVPPQPRGRPKLGVVAREVTLLPRHWEWLGGQPGGTSVTLRKLVEDARRSGGARQHMRTAREAAYRFMSAIAGDLPGFEEAIRALFADDRALFESKVAGWPEDVRAYAASLGFGHAPACV